MEERLVKTIVPGFKDHLNVGSELAGSPEEWGRRTLQRDPSERGPPTKLGLHQSAFALP